VWLPIIDRLAQRHTVIAPDLLGHGRSDKPRAGYSVGGYANGMRDLLTVLGINRVTSPATHHRVRWRALLKNGAPAGPVHPDTRVVTIA
jgi:pimeloyl-ACP methyl ester carboxylesterase